MPRTLLLTGLRDLLRRPLPTALLVAGVALGVAVVVAIDLASGAARLGFERSARALFGRLDAQEVESVAVEDHQGGRTVRLAGLKADQPQAIRARVSW